MAADPSGAVDRWNRSRSDVSGSAASRARASASSGEMAPEPCSRLVMGGPPVVGWSQRRVASGDVRPSRPDPCPGPPCGGGAHGRGAGGYRNQALWSDDGWTWLGGRDATRLPLHCNGDVPDQPRTCITWYQAEAYAAWRAGRLPTEAEWEYAARGPKSTVYPWGDTFDRERANVLDSVSPKPVGSYPTGASWVGAVDMSGNAMEWVADWLDTGYYTSSPATDPTGPATGEVKVEKGGWWGSNEFVARSAYRHYEDPPTYGDKHIGFRVASQ